MEKTPEQNYADLRYEVKGNLIEAINALMKMSQNVEFDNLKPMYKDKIFDSMKKLTQIKDEI